MHSTIIFYGYYIIEKNIKFDTDIIICKICKPYQAYIKYYDKPQWFRVVCCNNSDELFYGFCISSSSKVTSHTLDKFKIYDTMLKDYKFEKMKNQLQNFYNEYKREKNERSITLRKIHIDYSDTVNIIDLYANYYSDSEPEESEEYTYGIHIFNELCVCWNL